ncbi:MAG: tail fiber domain-containing protein [Ferruginibacter sp.]
MKLFFCITLIAFSHTLFAQNIGIGTANPAFKLDVSGGSINTDSVYRINGSTILSAKGNDNTLVGINSGLNNTGIYNSTLGKNSLFSNTTGSSNIAIGRTSLYSNITGGHNTAVGGSALYRNTIGAYNSAFGGSVLLYNINGDYNTGVGYGALIDNTSGKYNVASGYYSLEENTAGSGNTGIGVSTLNLTISSSYNTAIGYKAGHGFNHGWNNTFLGTESNVTGTGLYNSIAIGATANATASNQARIGNSSTTSTGGFTNWTNISDGRFKKNIQEDVKGLDFIMKLKPVTYQLDIQALSKKLNEHKSDTWNTDMQIAAIEKAKIIQSGFIAQDVETAAKELGYDFSGVDNPKNENDFYGLRYAEFVVPLVKAVQEQQQLIYELKKNNASQKGIIDGLIKRLEKLEGPVLILSGR